MERLFALLFGTLPFAHFDVGLSDPQLADVCTAALAALLTNANQNPRVSDANLRHILNRHVHGCSLRSMDRAAFLAARRPLAPWVCREAFACRLSAHLRQPEPATPRRQDESTSPGR